MPSSNGVYSLPTGYLAVTGATIQASQHNPPLEDIAAGLTARLSRDGSAPMTGALKLLPGTAAAPGAAFSTDATTGILKTTNGIGISVGGTQVVEFTAAGIASGVWLPGMLIPYAGRTAPSSLWVLPYGQTLSRTTYAALWAFAQVEIAGGSTLFNNGDGSLTFGIPDLRGRVPAGFDSMGGTAANRLTSASFVGSLGAVGGSETHPLTLSELPGGITSSNGAQQISVNSTVIVSNSGGVSSLVPGGGSQLYITGGLVGTVTSNGFNSISVTSNNTGGGAHVNVPPTLCCNYLLFVGGPA